MSKPRRPSSDANKITVHGSVSNAALVAGHDNAVEVRVKLGKPLPSPESVDIRAALATIATTLRQLASSSGQELQSRELGAGSRTSKIEHALAEAEEEVEKPEPDRREVGKALDRALGYARAATGFADALTKLEPQFLAAVSWLGEHGVALLRTVGLA
jgi:hypothetical protein